MEHGESAHEQHDVHQQRQAGDKTGNPIVKRHAYQRDRQPDQTSENARANGIRTECRRDASFFLDAHWGLQRVLKHAGEPARFFFAEMTGDYGITTVYGIANHGRGLNDPIQDDGKTVTFVLLGDLAKFFCALAIEF